MGQGKGLGSSQGRRLHLPAIDGPGEGAKAMLEGLLLTGGVVLGMILWALARWLKTGV